MKFLKNALFFVFSLAILGSASPAYCMDKIALYMHNLGLKRKPILQYPTPAIAKNSDQPKFNQNGYTVTPVFEYTKDNSNNSNPRYIGCDIQSPITPSSRPFKWFFGACGAAVGYYASLGLTHTLPIDDTTKGYIAWASATLGGRLGYKIGSVNGQRINPIYVKHNPILAEQNPILLWQNTAEHIPGLGLAYHPEVDSNRPNLTPIQDHESYTGYLDETNTEGYKVGVIYEKEKTGKNSYRETKRIQGYEIYPIITPASGWLRFLSTVGGAGIGYYAAAGVTQTLSLDAEAAHHIGLASAAVGSGIGYAIGSSYGKRVEPIYMQYSQLSTDQKKAMVMASLIHIAAANHQANAPFDID